MRVNMESSRELFFSEKRTILLSCQEHIAYESKSFFQSDVPRTRCVGKYLRCKGRSRSSFAELRVSGGETHEARSGSRFWFRLVPTLRTELFSTARIYKSKGTWVRERSSAIPKINEPIGRRLLPRSACGGGSKEGKEGRWLKVECALERYVARDLRYAVDLRLSGHPRCRLPASLRREADYRLIRLKVIFSSPNFYSLREKWFFRIFQESFYVTVDNKKKLL